MVQGQHGQKVFETPSQPVAGYGNGWAQWCTCRPSCGEAQIEGLQSMLGIK
jgi:hypothetical protein